MWREKNPFVGPHLIINTKTIHYHSLHAFTIRSIRLSSSAIFIFRWSMLSPPLPKHDPTSSGSSGSDNLSVTTFEDLEQGSASLLPAIWWPRSAAESFGEADKTRAAGLPVPSPAIWWAHMEAEGIADWCNSSINTSRPQKPNKHQCDRNT